MRRHTQYSIAAFRKWRRAISAAVVPAFACWSLSAAACFGMPLDVAGHTMPASAHAGHDMSSAHAAHGMANDMHEHMGMGDCAHCPPKADDGQATPSVCLTGVTSNANATKAGATPNRSLTRPWIGGMMAPPTIAMTRPAAANLVSTPRPCSATP